MKPLLILLLLFLQIPHLSAQWDEEQAYVRQLAEAMPLKTVEVYLQGKFCRTYNYDFYRHYLGYTQYLAGQKTQGLLRLYDDTGFLTEETLLGDEVSENDLFYRYDSLGNQVWKEECYQVAILDTIDGEVKRSDRSTFRCHRYQYVFDGDRLVVEERIEVDSVYRKVRTFEYQDGRLKTTRHFAPGGTALYEEILEYTADGRTSKLWLQKGPQKLLKTAWEYDEYGRLALLAHENVQYGVSRFKARPEEATLLNANHHTESKFKYDKQGRVSTQAFFINGNPGSTLTYKYIAPDK